MRRPRLILAIGISAILSMGALSAHAAAPAAGKATIKAATGGQSFIFAPAKKTIKVGTKVTWTNPTEAPHTVTSKTKSWKFTKQLPQSGKVTFTFKKAGTYHYYCQFHPGMVGTIKVTM